MLCTTALALEKPSRLCKLYVLPSGPPLQGGTDVSYHALPYKLRTLLALPSLASPLLQGATDVYIAPRNASKDD
eukprot:347386-Pelagomonas_calceolata.AAC.5